MIDNIKLTNFKAYTNREIKLDKKNLLLYGDNGTGKSSIFECFKVSFFKERLIGNISCKAEEKNQKINEVFSREYDNKKNPNFEIKINDIIIKADENIESFNINSNLINLYSVELTEIENGDSTNEVYKTLNLKTLLLREFLTININEIDTKKDKIIEDTNTLLNKFEEDIQIKIDNTYNITINDENRNIGNTDKFLNLYFNEAKLNLIILLLLFNSIKELSDEEANKLIVLDDFITSLDIANRTFLLKFLLESFSADKFQLIILTHNLEFFNLTKYILTEKIPSNSKQWLYQQLFEINNEIEISDVNPIDFSLIEREITNNPVNAGNLIRKKFETMIHSMSKDLIIGSVEASNNILTTFLNNDVIYLKSLGTGKSQKFFTSNHLVSEIENKISQNSSIDDILTLIEGYKITNEKLIFLKDILKELKLYRKVIMHPLSHTEAQFSIRELYKSLNLLKNLDENIVLVRDENNTQ